MTVGQVAKSKTIQFNTLVPALAGVLTLFGIAVPAEVLTGVVVLGNFVLRLITKEAISDK